MVVMVQARPEADIVNLEAEMATLGSAIIGKPEHLAWFCSNVPAKAFGFPAHAEIAKVIHGLQHDGTAVELLTVKNALLRQGGLALVGGEDYLIQVAESVPSAANVEHYGAIVLEDHGKRVLRRRLVRALQELDVSPLSKMLEVTPRLAHGLRNPAKVDGPGLSTVVSFNGDFKPVDVDYLIEPYFPKGKSVLVDADGGTGKTSWLLSVAAGLSRGSSAFGTVHGPPVRTLLLYRDADRAEEYETIYRANGGVPGWISYSNDGRILTAEYAEEIIQTVRRGGFGFVIFDPFFYFLPPTTNTNDAIQALPVCQLVNHIAAETGAVCAVVRHTSKGSVDKQASDLGMGSVQFRNSFRGQMVLRWHPQSKEDPHYRGVVVATDEKGSILVPRGDTFQFRRVDREVQYIESAGDNPFHKRREQGDGTRGPTADRRRECESWLKAQLGTNALLARDIIPAGIDAGFSRNTIYRAKDALKLVVSTRGSYQTWALPEYDPYADTDGHDHVYRGGD
jgi:hypothetical protein